MEIRNRFQVYLDIQYGNEILMKEKYFSKLENYFKIDLHYTKNQNLNKILCEKLLEVCLNEILDLPPKEIKEAFYKNYLRNYDKSQEMELLRFLIVNKYLETGKQSVLRKVKENITILPIFIGSIETRIRKNTELMQEIKEFANQIMMIDDDSTVVL